MDLSGNVVVVNAEKYANTQAISGYMDREGKQVSVHSSHRYHENILEDVIQVLSSVDRDLISDREPIQGAGQPDEPLNNHYRLI